MRPNTRRGLTLIELVLVMAVSGILALMTPLLMFHGVKTLVFLPRALAANQVATEIMHQIAEGGWSTLPGQSAPVRGLRLAVRGATQEAVWHHQPTQVGFRTSDDQCVFIQLASGVMQRSVSAITPITSCVIPAGSETIPYDTMGVQILTPGGPLFQYYSPGGVIRRVDVAFVAQTGTGLFEEGHAREDIKSSVAIRVP